MSGTRIQTGPFGSKSHARTLYCGGLPRCSLPGGHQREGSKGESKTLSPPQPHSPYQLLDGRIKNKRTNTVFLGREPCNLQGDWPQKCLSGAAGLGSCCYLAALNTALVISRGGSLLPLVSEPLQRPISTKGGGERAPHSWGPSWAKALPAAIPRRGRRGPWGGGNAHNGFPSSGWHIERSC